MNEYRVDDENFIDETFDEEENEILAFEGANKGSKKEAAALFGCQTRHCRAFSVSDPFNDNVREQK